MYFCDIMDMEPSPSFESTALDEHLHVRLFISASTVLGPWWAGPFYSSFWRLYCNGQPGARIKYNGGILTLEPGRIVIVPSWVRFTGDADAGIEHSYIHFDVIGMPGSLIREIFSRPIQLADDPALERVSQPW